MFFRKLFNFSTVLTVRAYVESPDSALHVVDLVDTGVGADTSKSDGIYSRYYVALNIPGRYTLVCQVNNTQATYIDDGITSQQRTTMGNFSRVQSGGNFRVNAKNLFVDFIVIE